MPRCLVRGGGVWREGDNKGQCVSEQEGRKH